MYWREEGREREVHVLGRFGHHNTNLSHHPEA